MAVSETGMSERLEQSAAREAAPNYSLIAGAYFPDVVPETSAGTDARLCQSGTLADSLLVRPAQYFSNSLEESAVATFNQHLADRIASRFFEPALAHLRSANLAPAYRSPNRQLHGKDSADISQHEKERWSSIFECIVMGTGVLAAHRWAPRYMPPKATPLAFLAAKNPTGVHHMLYSGPTHAELVKEMKARYIATCIGGMAAGWAANHIADKVFFSHEQYMEATLAGDLSGIGLAIVVPGFPKKAALVAGSHLLGKTIDHWRQPRYPCKSNP